MGVRLISRGSFRHHLTLGVRITRREAEERETWRDMDDVHQREFRNGPFSQLPCGGGDLVRTADKIIKVSYRQSHAVSVVDFGC